jgi:hypothetical protein
MNVYVVLAVVLIGFWIKAIFDEQVDERKRLHRPQGDTNSGSRPKPKQVEISGNRAPDERPADGPSTSTNVGAASNQNFGPSRNAEHKVFDTSDYRVSQKGFQPDDKCSCGGSWIKRENMSTGGRFFSCSRYPNCTKNRDQVLKERLGDRYRDFYCSRGHELDAFGTTTDPKSGREMCNRCIANGYVQSPGPKSPSAPQTGRQSDKTQRSGERSQGPSTKPSTPPGAIQERKMGARYLPTTKRLLGPRTRLQTIRVLPKGSSADQREHSPTCGRVLDLPDL